ncbi:LOW QUALITY PROTEIN: coiled-coil domain-containing protein 40 [Gadus morhua]|uniref:LOW QUALITY PROTEIN: coiled-coil domain-containing protein 40 n=1 Tax=Gadus morhua TaxID=8049 RepID=UPI0011B766EE|nr:LOW QUALITY PROTEIN: coiled-coil domain-containing protein 40 [Gadus morhua]
MMENPGSEGEGEEMEQAIGQDPSNVPVETDALGDSSDGEQTEPGPDERPGRPEDAVPPLSEPDDVDEDQTTPWFPTAEGSREEEEDEEEEKIILDPDHPLVRGFQNALKNQLTRKLQRLELDLKDKNAQLKAEAKGVQELGEKVYQVQAALARRQSQLEDHHRTSAQMASDRREAQEKLEVVKKQYSRTTSEVAQERSQVSTLRTEKENLLRRLFYMQEVNTELGADIEAMRNATRKAQAEKSQAELYKVQDLYVDRLTKDLERVTEEAAVYEAQGAAQKRETQAVSETLSEVQLETDSLAMEKRQLLQQWDSSLVGMRRRDEAFSAMQDPGAAAVPALEGELDAYRRSIVREQEKNEALTLQLKRAQLDALNSTKLIAKSRARQEALQAEYSTYARTLTEDGAPPCLLGEQRAELTGLGRGLEKESGVRLELEERVVTQMQKGLIHDKDAKYSKHLAGKMATLKKERMSQLWKLEAEVAAAGLASSEASHRLDALAVERASLEAVVSKQTRVLATSQAKVTSCMTVIERNQATVNGYNSKIQKITASTGSAELTPLQMQAQALGGQLEELEASIKKEQHRWSVQQGVLVALTQERQANGEKTRKLLTQHTILQQRKLRTQSELQAERREQAELAKGMSSMRGDMLKLSSLISKNDQQQQALEQDNSLMEAEFTQKLKEAERESVDMLMRLEKSQEEKEKLINSLVEAERQVMLWERKSQLARETRAALDCDAGQGDIRAMKAEIHRMEVRYGQLQKQQERLLRESEATVERRETLLLQAERGAGGARDGKQTTTVSQMHRTNQGLRRKILDTNKKASENEEVIKEMQESQVRLGLGISEKKQELSELRGTHADMTSDIHNLQDTKERNLSQLVSLQGRAKLLQAVRDGRYTPLSTPEAVDEALRRQWERVHAVSAILHRVCQESPQNQGALRALTRSLAARVQASSPGPDTA